MPVTSTDIKQYKSSVGSSDGGTRSGTQVTSAKNDLFPDVSDASRIAGGSMTKKVFIANDHGTDDLVLPSTWVDITPTNTTESLGLGWDDADDDDNTQGNMTAFGANAVVALVSDGADTRTATVVGLNASAVPTSENVVLNGATEVLTVATFSVVYGVHLSAVSASRTVTIKQGSGGTTRGTIGPNLTTCWLWMTVVSKATGIRLPNVVAGSEYGLWDRITWSPAVGAVRPNTSRLGVEEM